jgi:hypothetical protein
MVVCLVRSDYKVMEVDRKISHNDLKGIHIEEGEFPQFCTRGQNQQGWMKSHGGWGGQIEVC